MADKDPWAGVFTLGGMWLVPHFICEVPRPDGSVARAVPLFTTLGAAQLYLNGWGRRDLEPVQPDSLADLVAALAVYQSGGVTRFVLDRGTDRERHGTLHQLLGVLDALLRETRVREGN